MTKNQKRRAKKKADKVAKVEVSHSVLVTFLHLCLRPTSFQDASRASETPQVESSEQESEAPNNTAQTNGTSDLEVKKDSTAADGFPADGPIDGYDLDAEDPASSMFKDVFTTRTIIYLMRTTKISLDRIRSPKRKGR